MQHSVTVRKIPAPEWQLCIWLRMCHEMSVHGNQQSLHRCTHMFRAPEITTVNVNYLHLYLHLQLPICMLSVRLID